LAVLADFSGFHYVHQYGEQVMEWLYRIGNIMTIMVYVWFCASVFLFGMHLKIAPFELKVNGLIPQIKKILEVENEEI